jgi:hypothetical protein
MQCSTDSNQVINGNLSLDYVHYPEKIRCEQHFDDIRKDDYILPAYEMAYFSHLDNGQCRRRILKWW